jgi:Zn-dependent protease with chaperone function
MVKEATNDKIVKLRWEYKLSIFAVSVFALSLFFAGWREINTIGSVQSWLLFLAGIFLTVVFVGFQAYWIYFEEKSKGNLKKRVEFFERLHQGIQAAKEQARARKEIEKKQFGGCSNVGCTASHEGDF